jgi:hypothetical protein
MKEYWDVKKGTIASIWLKRADEDQEELHPKGL